MQSHTEPTMMDKSAPSVTLETIIAMGLFGWLALSITLMGLGIW